MPDRGRSASTRCSYFEQCRGGRWYRPGLPYLQRRLHSGATRQNFDTPGPSPCEHAAIDDAALDLAAVWHCHSFGHHTPRASLLRGDCTDKHHGRDSHRRVPGGRASADQGRPRRDGIVADGRLVPHPIRRRGEKRPKEFLRVGRPGPAPVAGIGAESENRRQYHFLRRNL